MWLDKRTVEFQKKLKELYNQKPEVYTLDTNEYFFPLFNDHCRKITHQTEPLINYRQRKYC
jgi:hypothetical protein